MLKKELAQIDGAIEKGVKMIPLASLFPALYYIRWLLSFVILFDLSRICDRVYKYTISRYDCCWENCRYTDYIVSCALFFIV